MIPELTDENFASCGIGPLAAAKAVASLAEQAVNRDVVFIGTAGIFAPHFTKPYLVRATGVRWLQADERLGHAYSIPGIYPRMKLTSLPAWSKSLPSCEVVCTSTISLAAKLPDDLDPTHTIENLELYSCAHEVSFAARSFVALFGITNAIGPDAHQQWRTHHSEAASLTAQFISTNWSSISRPL